MAVCVCVYLCLCVYFEFLGHVPLNVSLCSPVKYLNHLAVIFFSHFPCFHLFQLSVTKPVFHHFVHCSSPQLSIPSCFSLVLFSSAFIPVTRWVHMSVCLCFSHRIGQPEELTTCVWTACSPRGCSSGFLFSFPGETNLWTVRIYWQTYGHSHSVASKHTHSGTLCNKWIVWCG